MRKNALRLLGALLALVVAAGPAAAQDRDAEMVDLTLVTSEGDVISTRTPNEDNLHVFGSFTVATADYFRGAFDGVEEDLDEWSYRPTLGLAVDLAQGTGALTNLSLTLGMANGFTNTDYDHAAKQRESWYKGDFFTGLAANLFDDFLAGLTYISSAGLAALHMLTKMFRGESASAGDAWGTYKQPDREIGLQGHVKLFKPSPEVDEVLDTTGFKQFFEIYTDMDMALQSYGPAIGKDEA